MIWPHLRGVFEIWRGEKCPELKCDTDPPKSYSRIFTTVFETEFLPIFKKWTCLDTPLRFRSWKVSLWKVDWLKSIQFKGSYYRSKSFGTRILLSLYFWCLKNILISNTFFKNEIMTFFITQTCLETHVRFNSQKVFPWKWSRIFDLTPFKGWYLHLKTGRLWPDALYMPGALVLQEICISIDWSPMFWLLGAKKAKG